MVDGKCYNQLHKLIQWGGCCDDERLPGDEDGDAAVAVRLQTRFFVLEPARIRATSSHGAIFFERGGGGCARAAAGGDEGDHRRRGRRPAATWTAGELADVWGITGLLADEQAPWLFF